jgi:hypothetical protein
MKEFEELLIPSASVHTHDPVDDDEVMRRQHRPTQRRILADAEARYPERKVSMFSKVEAYPNVKPPRPISVMDSVDKREYSKFLYAFEAVMKHQPWYAFSKTPRDIAARVVDVLEFANMATNTDFSKFDGHGSNVMRELEQRILLRAFRTRHHAKLLELHRAQFNLKAYGTFGTQYQTRFARASGSPETSLFNSLVNAFVSFLALRMTKKDGVYLSPEEAFSRLGIYGGDDGLTADVKPDILRNAATMLGQELATTPVQRGELGIVFLARVYSPDVWFGDENTCCDVPRQLAKFHVTPRLNSNVTPTMKLLEKVRCFLLTDENTPIIGDYCVAVSNAHGKILSKHPDLAPVTTWLSNWEKEHQYKNDDAMWMVSYVQSVLPEFDFKRFEAWVQSGLSVDQLMRPPMFQEPVLAKSSEPVVLDGDVLPIGAVINEPPVRPEERKIRDGLSMSTMPVSTLPPLPTCPRPKLPERKVNLVPAITNKDQKTWQPTLPTTTFETKTPAKPTTSRRVELWKAKKLLAGTWRVDPPKVNRPNLAKTTKESKDTRAKVTPEQFAAWKAQRVAAGLWTDKPANPKPKRTPEEFAAWKTARIAAGTWVDKPGPRSRGAVT